MTQPPGMPPPPPGTPPPPYAGHGYYPPMHPRETSSKAVIALILGILSFVSCGPFTSIPAIFVARSATREIDASHGRLDGRSMATAGLVLGIIGTVVSVLAILFLVAVVLIGVTVGGTTCVTHNATFTCS